MSESTDEGKNENVNMQRKREENIKVLSCNETDNGNINEEEIARCKII